MPYKSKQPCKAPGCTALVDAGYCDKHAGDRTVTAHYDIARGSSHKRGYDWTWRQFSSKYKRRNPVCADCKRAWAEEVHHKVKLADAPELKYEESNLLGLCKPCHTKRTAAGQ